MADEAATEVLPSRREEATEVLTRLQAAIGEAPDGAIVEFADAFGDIVVRVRRDAWPHRGLTPASL